MPERRRRVAPFVALGVAIVVGALFVVLAHLIIAGETASSSEGAENVPSSFVD